MRVWDSNGAEHGIVTERCVFEESRKGRSDHRKIRMVGTRRDGTASGDVDVIHTAASV